MNHAVVGMVNSDPESHRPVIFDAIHDPHPDGTFIRDGSLFALGFLVALNPARAIQGASGEGAPGVNSGAPSTAREARALPETELQASV